MPTAKRLRPPTDSRVFAPQCCVPIARRRRCRMRAFRHPARLSYDPDLCQFPAAFMIDGKPYCVAHAKTLALRALMNET